MTRLGVEERENTFPRFDNLQTLDLTRFRGSMREIGWGNSLPRGEGEHVSASR